MKFEEIEKLCNEATPGPWYYENCGTSIYNVHAQKLLNKQHLPTRMEVRSAVSEDMEFITMARTELPKLLAVAKAAKACRKFSKISALSPMRMLEGEELLKSIDTALEELEKE